MVLWQCSLRGPSLTFYTKHRHHPMWQGPLFLRSSKGQSLARAVLQVLDLAKL